MKNYEKYRIGYYNPPAPCGKWMEKDHIAAVYSDGRRVK